MFATYEEFVRALESRREDISPLQWAAGRQRDPRISGWLMRWLREQRTAPKNHTETGPDGFAKGAVQMTDRPTAGINWSTTAERDLALAALKDIAYGDGMGEPPRAVRAARSGRERLDERAQQEGAGRMSADSMLRKDYEAMVAARDLAKRQTAQIERRYQESQRNLNKAMALNAELAGDRNALREECQRLMDELNTARLRLYRVGEIAAQEKVDEDSRLAAASAPPESATSSSKQPSPGDDRKGPSDAR